MFYNNLPKRTNNHLHSLYKSEEEIGAEALAKAEEADLILKGRKGEPIGTRKKWGNQEYIKTAQGWKADKGHASTHQSDSFEHNGHTIQRHHSSHTQGTYTVHKDGKQVGEGHYSQEVYGSKNDGRGNQFKKTDKEIKEEVDHIVGSEAKKQKVMDLLKDTTYSEGLKRDIAKYFVSPAFPDLKDMSEFKGKTVEETAATLGKLTAFNGGRFTSGHAKTIAEALHGKEQSGKKDIEEFSKMYKQSMGKTIPAPKGISDHAIAAYNDVAGGMSSEEFYKKHKVGDYDSYKETATKNGNAKMERAEAKPESKVIGKTSSGKDIHYNSDHESHANFTKEDHLEAAQKHISERAKVREGILKKHGENKAAIQLDMNTHPEIKHHDTHLQEHLNKYSEKLEQERNTPAEPAKPAFNADKVANHLKGLTQRNNHGEALHHLAKELGHKEAEEKLAAINKQHERQGYLSMDQSQERYGVYQDLMKHVKEHHGDEAHKKIYGSL